MLYFAYGSNLSTLRLLQRVPSARLFSTGQLHRHKLVFHKIGRDGSAKCNAFFTGRQNDFLLGALYSIHPDHKSLLDAAEGLGNGYETKLVTIQTHTDTVVNAFTYYATRISGDIKPFHWYKEHVLAGAREHSFPRQYVDQLSSVESIRDNNATRTSKELSMYTAKVPCNRQAGIFAKQ